MATNLLVFYGWSKINKIRKREAISVIFENGKNNTARRDRFINQMQTTVYTRKQSEEEAKDAEDVNRMYTEYSIFLDDRKIGGSLDVALNVNYKSDRMHVGIKMLNEIKEALRYEYLSTHRGYKEPIRQLTLFD